MFCFMCWKIPNKNKIYIGNINILQNVIFISGHFYREGISYKDWMDCNVKLSVPICKNFKNYPAERI